MSTSPEMQGCQIEDLWPNFAIAFVEAKHVSITDTQLKTLLISLPCTLSLKVLSLEAVSSIHAVPSVPGAYAESVRWRLRAPVFGQLRACGPFLGKKCQRGVVGPLYLSQRLVHALVRGISSAPQVGYRWSARLSVSLGARAREFRTTHLATPSDST